MGNIRSKTLVLDSWQEREGEEGKYLVQKEERQNGKEEEDNYSEKGKFLPTKSKDTHH